MNILVTGGTGFIGTELIKTLRLNKKYAVKILTRNLKLINSDTAIKYFYWNPEKNEFDAQSLIGVDVVIHLAGESIASGRWTEKIKKNLLDSRINGTRLLLNEIKKLSKPPVKFISSSAIGYYGNRHDEILDECSSKGSGFLADLCSQWEAETLKPGILGIKSCVVRTGVVLDKNGGALKKMLVPFNLGIGGKIGSGNQFMSWIHIEDLINIFLFLIESKSIGKIYNATAPNPVKNKDFTKILGRILRRPTIFFVPAIVLKIVFGEMSQVLLDGQRVIPKRLLEEKFTFRYIELDSALKAII